MLETGVNSTKPYDKAHFMALDGLRGVAALVVVFYHRRWWFGHTVFHHGYLAVDFFFALSGFVIACAYQNRLCKKKMSFAAFVRVRMIRLVPLLAVGTLLGVLVQVMDAVTRHWTGGIARAVAAAPIAALALPVPWLQQPFGLDQPSWSLFFELVINFAFALTAGRLTNRWLGIVVGAAGLGLIALIASVDLAKVGWDWPMMAAGLVRVTAPFAVGVALYRLHQAGKLPRVIIPFWLLAVVLSVALVMPEFPGLLERLYLMLCCLVLFPLLILTGCQARIASRWVTIVAFSAELSYPVYILHHPMLALFDMAGNLGLAPGGKAMLVEVVLIVIIAVFAARRGEVPLRRMLERYAKRSARP